MRRESGRYFEDFVLGDRIEHAGGRTVTEGDAAVYLSLTGDRHPLHSDREYARQLGYERETINELLVFNIVFGKTVPDISQNAVANLGYADVRFGTPVYPGDTLRVSTKIVGVKQNSNGKTGTVYVRTEGVNQNNETVLRFDRWVMVPKRDAQSRPPATTVPDLPESVSLSAISIGIRATSPDGDSELDWRAGDRIHYGPGMTIEETEHASATRLYQNTARVHFDGAFMQRQGGKRLVYGGHIISLAWAMSVNGIPGAMRMLAWNGGTHANPVYAGDTVYAFSDILEINSLPEAKGISAVRMRLVGVKDLDPMENRIDVSHMDTEKGRKIYHSNVVLDLDCWVAVRGVPRNVSSRPQTVEAMSGHGR